MPYTNGQTVRFGSADLSLHWCSYGCNKGHIDVDRIVQHEQGERDRPPILALDSPNAGNLKFVCGSCKWRGEQPFDIHVHRCPIATFECPKRKPEPKVHKKQRQSSVESAGSSSSLLSTL